MIQSLQFLIVGFLDSLAGHFMLVVYLLAVTDEQAAREKLKKLPPLLLSPAAAILASLGLHIVLESGILRYMMTSGLILAMCSFWTMWALQLDFQPAFSAVCMAGILQVATSALGQMLYLMFPADLRLDFVAMAFCLCFSIAVSALLKRFRFGVWFRLLLEDRSNLHRTVVLLLALEMSMETFLILQKGVQEQYLAAYYSLVVVLVAVIIGLIVHLARQFDDGRMLRVQQDVIAQQRLYEQNLEEIRREVRAFRHDYKNLLAGLSAEEENLEAIHSMAAGLEAEFDRNLGEKIRVSVQIGNLQICQVRSFLLHKLSDMQKKGVECRLEVLYPVEKVNMNVWDFVRCLGVLTDNAIEAALNAEQHWVEIILLAQNGRVFLRVSNPYANAIDPTKIWDEGWSTKGAGRGMGLFGYQQILNRYSNISSYTVWEDGVFVQELTVEGIS